MYMSNITYVPDTVGWHNNDRKRKNLFSLPEDNNPHHQIGMSRHWSNRRRNHLQLNHILYKIIKIVN